MNKGIMEETPVIIGGGHDSPNTSMDLDQANATDRKCKADFSLIWTDLTYAPRSLKKSKSIQITPSGDTSAPKHSIFNKLNGRLNSGELTALIGPSGSGKTTLIECIAGIRSAGREGNVYLRGSDKVRMAFIPQADSFFTLLTVKEALTYAAKFRKSIVPPKGSKVKPSRDRKERRSDVDEEGANGSGGEKKVAEIDVPSAVASVIKTLSLEKCMSTLLTNCSGGQLKRLSIAQELLAEPNILILDEPTSGLDSQTAVQTIELLHKLAIGSPGDGSSGEQMAILITIHQPSAKIFSMFHKVYVLSCIGKCIYQNRPGEQLMKFLKSFNLQVPQFTNTADYLMDVASGEFGKEILVSMSAQAGKGSQADENDNFSCGSAIEQGQMRNLSQMIAHDKYSLMNHVGLHFTRSMLVMMRDPQMSFIRVASHILVGLFMGYLYSEPSIGASGGCPPEPDDLLDPRKIDQVLNKIDLETRAVANNVGLIFFSMIFLLFAGMLPTVLTYPLEMSALAKERTNGWYSIFTYYIGRTLADIPLQILCPVLYIAIIFVMSNQPLEFPRLLDVCIPSILLSMVAQSHGVLVSAIFSSSIQVALFVAPISTIPLIVFAGFFIKTNAIPYYLKPGIYISYLRYASDMCLIALYGMDRCGTGVVSNVALIEKRMKLYLTHIISQGLAVDEVTNDTLNTSYLVETIAESSAIANVTGPLVKGITRPFSSKVITKNGESVTGVLAEFGLTDPDWAIEALIMLGTLFLIRLFILIVIYRNGRLVK